MCITNTGFTLFVSFLCAVNSPPPPTHTPVIFLAIGLGVFADIDQDFAGFFSLESQATDGCLSYGFGIALAAFIINVIATVVGIVAIFYKTFATKQHSKQQ